MSRLKWNTWLLFARLILFPSNVIWPNNPLYLHLTHTDWIYILHTHLMHIFCRPSHEERRQLTPGKDCDRVVAGNLIDFLITSNHLKYIVLKYHNCAASSLVQEQLWRVLWTGWRAGPAERIHHRTLNQGREQLTWYCLCWDWKQPTCVFFCKWRPTSVCQCKLIFHDRPCSICSPWE